MPQRLVSGPHWRHATGRGVQAVVVEDRRVPRREGTRGPSEDRARDALAPGIAAAECGADGAEVVGGEDVARAALGTVRAGDGGARERRGGACSGGEGGGATTGGGHGAPPVGGVVATVRPAVSPSHRGNPHGLGGYRSQGESSPGRGGRSAARSPSAITSSLSLPCACALRSASARARSRRCRRRSRSASRSPILRRYPPTAVVREDVAMQGLVTIPGRDGAT